MEESVLSRWKTKQKNEGIPTGITKIPDNTVVPLSQGQHRLWFLQKLYPENSFYNYSESYVFTGGLKKNNLISSLQHIFKVNSILRSTYHQVDDTTYQKINKGELEVSYFDFLSDTSEQKSKKIDGIIYESASKAFDLSSFPLMRALLIRVDFEKHILCITMHHIITDKWSMGILREQLASNYDLLENNKPLPISLNRLQYEDYAYWQSSNNNFVDQLGYWQKKLSGEIPYLALPVDYQRGETTDFKGSFKVRHLDIGLSKKILATAKNMGCTPYVLLLSVYYVLLYRYTGQQDILIGSPISNRGSKELENIIGFFNETVVLRTLIKPEMSFDDLVESVRNTTLEAFSNKDVPFEMLVKTLNPERSLSINPFFRVMFLYHQVLPTPSFGKELSLAHSVLDLGVAKFDLTLYVSEENGSLSTTFEYATDIFKEETIAQFQKHFETLLHQLISDREQCVSEVNMLTDKENKLFFKLSTEEGGYYSKYRNIHTIITEIGAENNDAVAVVYKNKSITYGKLLERSNRYAAAILKVTKGKNEIIGLCVERSIDMIVGILGILKSGCAYLPIDPEYPSERIDFMMRDAKVPMVISQKSVCSVFKNFEGIQLLLEDVLEAVSIPDVWPEILIDATAYVIYTSGSTGKPKGVPISHRNIIASTESRLSFYADQPKAFLLLSSVAFDSSKVGIFWTLCTGGTLVIGEKHIEQDMENLASVIKNNEITHTLMLPTLYNLCLEYCEPANLLSLQTVTVAGEACPTNLVKHHFEKLPQVRLYNEYGPTEATVWCIAHQVTKKDSETSVPIGKAVGHSEVYLLDKNGMLSPYGSVGEIYIGGPGLAVTYLNRPELDKEVYVDNPFIKKADAKLYKTGDLARYNSNGDLEFLGRLDQQLKIRGHRIELEEIEKKIVQQENVSQCVVVVQELNGNKQLLAFVITSDKTYAKEILSILRTSLPKHMIPSRILELDFFPQLPNGKVDKKALVELGKENTIKTTPHVEEAENETQRILVDIWKDLLQLESVSVNDNFFHLGGDSILSIRFIAKAGKMGITITPSQIFENQTILELANFVSQNEQQTVQWDYLVPLRKGGSKKPIFCIHAGGGHVFFYNILTKYLPSDRPIYALQASGFYGDKEMHNSIEEMAKDYITAIRSVQKEGPYNIMVYCFSVSVGNEMLLQLKRQGLSTNLVVMDTMTDPWRLNTPERLKMRVRAFTKRLRKQPGKTVKAMIAPRIVQLKLLLNKTVGDDKKKVFSKVNSNLAKICMEYEWVPHDEKITLILTEKVDKNINAMVVDSWKNIALGGVKIVKTTGDHINLFTEPNIVHVAKNLEENCI